MDFSHLADIAEDEERALRQDANLSYINYKPFTDEDVITYILADLEKRVTHDVVSKLLALFVEMSAYIEAINLFFKGDSGIGKTYIAVETSKYFPETDVKKLADLTPKALSHMDGKLMDEFGKEIKTEDYPKKPRKKDFEEIGKFEEAEERYKEKEEALNQRLRKSYRLIDVSNQIWIFLETPDMGTLKTLRPLLSHDAKNIEFNFTDKTKSGQFKTKKVVVTGFPSTIFLTVDKKYIEELATRSFTATPELSENKIKESNKITNRKAVLPDENSKMTKEAQRIRQHILNIRSMFIIGKCKIVCPFDNLYELYPHKIARDMRDFKHLLFLIKSITALNCQQRVIQKRKTQRYILSSAEDVKFAFEILNIISETTRTGTDQNTMDFYWNIVVNNEGNITVKQFQRDYKIKYPDKKMPAQPTIRKWLDRLDELGYVNKTERAIENRINMYEPVITERENKEGNALLCKNNEQLSLFLEKGLKLWESGIDTTDTFKIASKGKDNKILWENIPISKVKDKILLVQNNNKVSILLSSKPPLFLENKAKQSLFKQNNEFPSFDSQKSPDHINKEGVDEN